MASVVVKNGTFSVRAYRATRRHCSRSICPRPGAQAGGLHGAGRRSGPAAVLPAQSAAIQDARGPRAGSEPAVQLQPQRADPQVPLAARAGLGHQGLNPVVRELQVHRDARYFDDEPAR